MTNYGPNDDRSYFPGGSYYGGDLLGNLPITSESAMRQMTVNNCVRVLYNCISQMPCQLMEEVDDIKNKATSHYLYKLIGKHPNSWMTAPQFYGMAIVHICLRGNFYAYKARAGNKIMALYPLHQIEFKWIKGHAGHAMNERCDQLATAAADGNELAVDEFYEREQVSNNLLI